MSVLLTVVAIAMMLALNALLMLPIADSFSELEEDLARRNAERVEEAIGAHLDNLTTALLEDAMLHTVLMQQRTQGKKVFLNSDTEGLVKIRHQLTNALLQRSLSLQLA